ncbi:MAG: nicotinate-nicotinamide nucleotide adenylyltransferase, partial [Gemmatimonadota bacterium]|nr:nicotinate-nicotinamide nucleotide adenylyltransferase [Gemmatimonadota bacterium]
VDAAERLTLDRLLWVPAAQQPHKAAKPHAASAAERLRMVRAAVAAHPAFEASRIEIERPGLSYTVATVQALADEFPGDSLFLLIGEDAWSRFSEWREPDRIRSLAQIEILARKTGSEYSGRVVEVSSTEVRARASAGRTVRGFVQDAVAEIIESERLYQWQHK